MSERAFGAQELVFIGALERVIEQLLFERGGKGLAVGRTALSERPAAEKPCGAFELRLGQSLGLRRGDEIGSRILQQQLLGDVLVAREAGPGAFTGAVPCEKNQDALASIRKFLGEGGSEWRDVGVEFRACYVIPCAAIFSALVESGSLAALRSSLRTFGEPAAPSVVSNLSSR